MTRSGGRKWLAYGCFGCLTVVGAVVLLVMAVAGTAWMGARSETVADRVLEPEVPTEAAATESESGAEPVGTPVPTAAGRVVLRLSGGEFRIRPARSGERLRVEAKYDEKSHALEESFEEAADGWTYEVTFRGTGSGLLGALKQAFGGTTPAISVYLPPDVPLSLEMELARGGAEIELGGLWLTRADVDMSQGGMELSVEEPLRVPMEELTINGRMGGCAISRLGNASPRRLDLTYRMGGMDLDLRGQWRQDSDISIDFAMGGGAVRLPRDVEILGVDSGRSPIRRPSDDEIPPPTLRFSVSSSQGELEFLD